mmetsp:Transcript_6212/g.12262  ORF Transcript_6212/g.12262 Transcript_6212/m.12262 type:complete len:427 (-) Transcript_6212:948-2228(-)
MGEEGVVDAERSSVGDSLMSQLSSSGRAHERYELHELLGSGASGDVYKAKDRVSGDWVAVKRVSLHEAGGDTMSGSECLELKTLMAVRGNQNRDCDHIFVELRDDFLVREEEELWIVTELCEAGSVADLMQWTGRKALDEPIIRAILRSVVRAILFLHSMHIIHRDIKAGNVLLNSSGHAKLGDLGVIAVLSKTVPKRNTSIGSPFWMAPEVIKRSDYGYAADIWSLGITAIELAEGSPPLSEEHPFRALFMIPEQDPPSLRHPTSWSPEFVDFISCCLKKDPAERLSARELMAHAFLADRNGENEVLLRLVEESLPLIDEARKHFSNGRMHLRDSRSRSSSSGGDVDAVSECSGESVVILSDNQISSGDSSDPKVQNEQIYLSYVESLEGQRSRRKPSLLSSKQVDSAAAIAPRMQQLDLEGDER